MELSLEAAMPTSLQHRCSEQRLFDVGSETGTTKRNDPSDGYGARTFCIHFQKLQQFWMRPFTKVMKLASLIL